ncbi:aromatic ring-hydroxylating dioxygenase subunit alpha [Alphaproteobacteria bacterium]|nr:aromatic ring-hydroxylating dioxygenase subunit alpha [Alphaproteobacteria bacterium]
MTKPPQMPILKSNKGNDFAYCVVWSLKMAPRNHKNWLNKPKIEFISSECYNNHSIYQQEIEQIFAKVWVPVCHTSEMSNKGDFRASQIAHQNVVAINRGDFVEAFLCPSIDRPTGNGLDTDGLQKLHSDVKHGGMVWVTLDPNPTQSVEEWTCGAFDCIAEAIDTEDLEVFHYHKAIIDTNYKLWHDTNSEFYHDFMHYFNRVSGFNDEYFARKNIPFDNGHVNVSSFTVNYEEYDGFEDRGELSFPNLPPNQWYMVDLFPGFNFNLRGSAYRSDSVTPLGPNKVLIEFRGYGLKSDSAEDRATRIKHHNSIWGPFGRNLHEDLIGVAGQGTTMREGTEARNILHGRHENSTIHDEVGMRHYYEAWGNFMGISSLANPLGLADESVIAAE